MDGIFTPYGQSLQGSGLPFILLIRMNTILQRYLRNCELLFEDFQNDLGFLFGGVSFSHALVYTLFWPVFVSKFTLPLKIQVVTLC
jgi:hypothetical protein